MNPDSTDPRLSALESWTASELNMQDWTISPASEDASFRRYFRISSADKSFILMDAPPEQEDIEPFIQVTEALLNANVQAPAIHAINRKMGFLMLDDLGQQSYLSALNDSTAEHLYQDAMSCLLEIQQADSNTVPQYSSNLLNTEMLLFDQWFLDRHLGVSLNRKHEMILDHLRHQLAFNANSQPQVFIHRDFHSRNLMVTTENNPGVIDYQDAVRGPITYDLVSLLRDCYIDWPAEQVQKWVLGYRDKLVAKGMMPATNDTDFMRWFDLMGIQRHMKAIGIFSRLSHRDGKPGYLQDIPRTLDYLLEVGERHPETEAFTNMLHELDIKQRLDS